MKTGTELLQELGIDTSRESIPLEEIEAKIAAVVECAGCTMTMTIFSALVSDDGFFFCESCAEPEDDPAQREHDDALHFHGADR